MDLSTTYLGFRLPHPLVAGASPLSGDLDGARRLEDAGAAAVVMNSLFAEQIDAVARSELTPEARALFPVPDEFALGPDEYLERIAQLKNSLRIPVVASLNGATLGGWLRFARLISEAGADALELNVYHVAADPFERGFLIEERIVEMLQAVKREVRIPVAVKLTPFYTSLPHLARHLDECGADGLVLFNRLYQPDIDPEEPGPLRTLHLSDSHELVTRLRWLAILSDRLRCSLAASGGVHTGVDAIKAVMCGAHAVQMVSALLRHGPGRLRDVKAEMAAWLERHDYGSLGQIRGVTNLARTADPRAWERANYLHVLQHWSHRAREACDRARQSKT